jgi:predicted hydrolase (HD superfamily)
MLINRDDAYHLLTKYLKNKNLIKHSLAAEVAMRGIYKHLKPKDEQTPEDEETWGITGLLHDIDYEVAQNENLLNKHGILLFERNEIDLPEDITHAIKAHNFHDTKIEPESSMDWAIVTADRLTGFITACALVRPDKKLASVTVESVQKKFTQKNFAAGANRESILLCETKLDIPLTDFIKIVLTAMQGISDDLGL